MCDDPACQIDMTDVRAMENQLRQYREEDTVLHREIHRMQADHAVALQREEEKGYARGLNDAGYTDESKVFRMMYMNWENFFFFPDSPPEVAGIDSGKEIEVRFLRLID